MSIEKCVSPLFKVREDLINGTETALRNIKVLTDLRILLCPACYRHEGPYGPEEGAFRMLRRTSETRRQFNGGGAFGNGFVNPTVRKVRDVTK